MGRIIGLIFLTILPALPAIERSLGETLPIKSTPVRHAEEAAFVRQFDDYFTSELKKTGYSGAAVVIVKDGDIIFEKGYGLRRYGTQDSVDTQTVFRIGSLSKGFAAVLTGQLVEEGYLNWDDKLQDIIPEFNLRNSDQASRITIRHILSHSTGIERHAFTDLVERGLSLEQIIPSFSRLPVYGREGEFFAYQNAAFSLIEEVLLRKTGKTYDQLLNEYILEPGKMNNISTSYQEICENTNTAIPHVRDKYHRCIVSKLNKKYYNAVSAGGINASIHDMGTWLQILMGHRPEIISSAVFQKVYDPVVRNKKKNAFMNWAGIEQNYYGLGWRILTGPERRLIYHGGSVNNYRSEIAFDPDLKIGICVLFNTHNYLATRIIPDFFQQYDQFLFENMLPENPDSKPAAEKAGNSNLVISRS